MAPIDDRDFWNIVRRECTLRHDGTDDARAELALLMIARPSRIGRGIAGRHAAR
jgi:hypothetical protein